MKRQQNTELSTRVYSFGCVPARIAPVRNEESALVQLRIGRRLWNTIVAVEQVRDERYRKIMVDENQRRADALGEEMATLRDQIRTGRKSVRARKVNLGDLPDRLAAVNAERSDIIAKLKRRALTRVREFWLRYSLGSRAPIEDDHQTIIVVATRSLPEACPSGTSPTTYSSSV